jgi:hypothetical protein
MIDLAISTGDDGGVTTVETNHGNLLAAPEWPQDSDFRLVVFEPRANECEVIVPRELARDIAHALRALKPVLNAAGKRHDWYYRLKKCASGASNS